MKSNITTVVTVSIVAGKIQLTVNGVAADSIQVNNGDSVSWTPQDSVASLALLFPPAEKPVSNPVYFGAPGQTITAVVEGIVNKHYRYSVIVFKTVPYTKSKPGELALEPGDIPPQYTVDVAAEDPVVIIR